MDSMEENMKLQYSAVLVVAGIEESSALVYAFAGSGAGASSEKEIVGVFFLSARGWCMWWRLTISPSSCTAMSYFWTWG